MDKLKEFAKEAVEASEKLDTSNEGKKRTAFAYINQKLIDEKIEDVNLDDIDKAIEEAL